MKMSDLMFEKIENEIKWNGDGVGCAQRMGKRGSLRVHEKRVCGRCKSISTKK